MAILHNRVSQKELKEKIKQDNTPRLTISFYNYFHIKEPEEFRNTFFLALNNIGVLGRIYLAHEGVNAQITVPKENLEQLKTYLNSIEGFKNIRLNIAVENKNDSFFVLKIKVRKKIVADGIDDENFSMENKGKYLNAKEFNSLTDDEKTIVVDMRNHYEYEVGHFQNAIEIPSDTFREQLPMAVKMLENEKEKNIVMYCTGGIRCEKASAYLKHNGFKNVYHLEGGIIHYAKNAKEENLPLKFIGKNFVFDERLGERITEDIISSCHQCGKPCDTHTNCINDSCHLLFIQCEICATEFQQCCTIACKDFINLPEDEQTQLRKGIDKGRMIFNKSKQRLRPRLNEE